MLIVFSDGARPKLMLCVYYIPFFTVGNVKKYEFFDNNMNFRGFSI